MKQLNECIDVNYLPMDNTTDNLNLILRNLKETIVDFEKLKEIQSKRPLRVYWGTACTSKIHIGYFVPMLKIADFLNAGCEVQILIADLHAFLDNMKSTLELIEKRSLYYETTIKAMLMSLGVDITRLSFVKGSSFQLSKEYTLDVYKANSLITIKDAQHAGAEVVKQSSNPILNSLLYPTLQSLDEVYLKADLELGGIDQRKIFMHSKKILPKLGYDQSTGYLMTEMIPKLQFKKPQANSSNPSEDKMSASDENSKIDVLDSKATIRSKINKVYCLERDISNNNCLLVLVEKLLFPILTRENKSFTINRDRKYGGPMVFGSFDSLKTAFENGELYPADLKIGVIDLLDEILTPIRKVFEEGLMGLLEQAYPKS